MGAFIHSNNVLLELSRMTTNGWVKELCYRTLTNGVLDNNGLQAVFELFVTNGVAASAEPAVTEEQQLRLTKLVHQDGVNALKAGSEMNFCDEGITLVYGQNGSGKSGYYRVLDHLAGGTMAKPVLENIYEAHPAAPACKINYKLDGVEQPLFDWDNTDAAKGKVPFDKITVFDSKYTGYLVKKHTPDTYLLNTHGFFDFADLQTNVSNLGEKVRTECPEKEALLNVPDLTVLNLDGIYDRYLSALQTQLDLEIKGLLGKNRGIVVAKQIEDGKPYLVVRLNAPYEVDNILSEGEIKAVALALVLSDLELKEKKNPLVLDDPVNSLDNNIIRRFATRLLRLENQVILFTHNVWLTNALYKSGDVKVYRENSQPGTRTNAKKHLIAYMVHRQGNTTGILRNYDKDDPSYYLSCAKECLDVVPFGIKEAESVTQLLRKAVELMVDEKIFLNQEPCKYRYGAQGILWADLQGLKAVPDAVNQKLQEQYVILSSGGTHTGLVGEEDPLEHDDLLEVYNELRVLL